MEIKKKYWMWKSTCIDFAKLSKEKVKGQNYTKVDYLFHYLPLPDDVYHEWYNGGWSSEYNEALRYAEELGLIEWIDEKETEKLVITAIEEYLNTHKYGLMAKKVTDMTSAYLLLDTYKNELIDRVYRGK